jgi:high affinity Mn2+ porin
MRNSSLAQILSVVVAAIVLAWVEPGNAQESAVLPASDATAKDNANAPEDWAVHGQTTFTTQYHPAFRSPYRGANSLDPGSRGNETFDATLYLGVRPWDGAEAWGEPEVDQGFGLSNTFGVAGFPSGEAYKVGKATPYFRLQRLFVRQTIDLGGVMRPVEADADQLAGWRTDDNLILTFGKLAVTDIFDTNSYAHDPRSSFLNWAIVDAGAYDYAADAWAYTYGGAAEWTQYWWTLRLGLFDLSRIPNGTALVRGLGQYELVGEAEERHSWWGAPGKLKLLVFMNRARMGSYDAAVKLGNLTGITPDTALVRKPGSRAGASLNFEQQLYDDVGLFVRASLNDGSKESFEFTDINKSLSTGLSLKGTAWTRKDDAVGIALVVNGISASARTYFAAGGLGTLIGDGRLLHYGAESILETYYNAAVGKGFTIIGDYQYVSNPAYNRDRGPVSILGVRLHAEF